MPNTTPCTSGCAASVLKIEMQSGNAIEINVETFNVSAVGVAASGQPNSGIERPDMAALGRRPSDSLLAHCPDHRFGEPSLGYLTSTTYDSVHSAPVSGNRTEIVNQSRPRKLGFD